MIDTHFGPRSSHRIHLLKRTLWLGLALVSAIHGRIYGDTIALYGWGTNHYGELGGGKISFANSLPVPVTTAGTPLAGKTISSLAEGQDHTLALCSDGTLASTGRNTNGQLGNGSTVDRTTFGALSISGTALAGKTVTAIAAGTVDRRAPKRCRSRRKPLS